MREHERFDWLTERELFFLEMCSNEEGQKKIYATKNPKNLSLNQSSQQHASSHVTSLMGHGTNVHQE